MCAAADGSVGGFAQVIDPQTDEVISSGGAPTIGSSLGSGHHPVRAHGGAAARPTDEVVIDADTAEEAGSRVGDEVRIVTPASV